MLFPICKRCKTLLRNSVSAFDREVYGQAQGWYFEYTCEFNDAALVLFHKVGKSLFKAQCPCVGLQCCSAAVSVPSRPVSSQRTETLIQLPSFRQLLACTAVTCLIPLLLQLTVLPGDGTGTVCYSVFPLSLTQWSPGYCAVNHYEAVLRLLVSH